jgi:hypothetical protein
MNNINFPKYFGMQSIYAGTKSQIYNCGHSGRNVLFVITNFTNYLQIVKPYMQRFI